MFQSPKQAEGFSLFGQAVVLGADEPCCGSSKIRRDRDMKCSPGIQRPKVHPSGRVQERAVSRPQAYLTKLVVKLLTQASRDSPEEF